MNSKDLVSMGFSAMLDEWAEKQLDSILDLTRGDPAYAEAERAIDTAMDAFHEVTKESREVRSAYNNVEAAYNHIASLEALAMYRKGFLVGMEMGLKRKRTPLAKVTSS